MPLRVLEAVLPETTNDEFKELVGDKAHSALWKQQCVEGGLSVTMLLSVEQTEPILDTLEERFGDAEGFRVVLMSVEATLPRVAHRSQEESDGGASIAKDRSGSEDEEEAATTARISREELYNQVVDSTKLNPIYIATVVLSALVAAVGLMQDSVVVIIGAMVIAPLLGPNVALALATTLGDFKLGRSALWTNVILLGLAFGVSVPLGIFLPMDPSAKEIASRTAVGFPDMVLALASGSAGVLAFTSGKSVALVGVMVAVALMPPVVAAGLMLGAGSLSAALGALMLVATNVICVNLAGIVTLVVQGVQPKRLEEDKARRMTRWASAIWVALLGVLIAIVALSESQR